MNHVHIHEKSLETTQAIDSRRRGKIVQNIYKDHPSYKKTFDDKEDVEPLKIISKYDDNIDDKNE